MPRMWWVGFCVAACTAGTSTSDSSGSTPTAETGDSTPPVDPCTLPLSVELGTGQGTYTPLDPGDPIQLTWGEQGGWHLWTAGKLGGLAGSAVTVKATGTRVSTGEPFAGVKTPATAIDLTQPGASYVPGTCSATFWGLFTFVDPAFSLPGYVCTLDGEELDFDIEITDLTSKAVATASVRVVAERDPAPENVCNSAP